MVEDEPRLAGRKEEQQQQQQQKEERRRDEGRGEGKKEVRKKQLVKA